MRRTESADDSWSVCEHCNGMGSFAGKRCECASDAFDFYFPACSLDRYLHAHSYIGFVVLVVDIGHAASARDRSILVGLGYGRDCHCINLAMRSITSMPRGSPSPRNRNWGSSGKPNALLDGGRLSDGNLTEA